MRLFIALILLFPTIVIADPSVTVTPFPHKNYSRVLFTIEQHNLEEMEGCHLNLFAADKANDLKVLPHGARSIATFGSRNSIAQIIALDIPRLSRRQLKKRFAKVYFRMLIPCTERGEFFMSDIVSARIKTSRRGKFKKVNRWTLWAKNHMRWATEEDLAEAGFAP